MKFEENIFKKTIQNQKSFKQEDIFNLEKMNEEELIEKFCSITHKNEDEIYINGQELPRDENGNFVDEEEFIFSQKYGQRDAHEKQKKNAIMGVSNMDENYPKKSELLKKLAETGTKKAINMAISFLGGEQDSVFYYQKEIMNILQIDKEYAAGKILNDYKNRQLLSIRAEAIIIIATDLIGAEETRNKINDLIETSKQLLENGKKYFFEGDIELDTEEIINELEIARALITPNHDKIAIENLQKFYQENIKFEDYKVNQEMNEGEVSLLKSLIRKDEKVLEEGCGTGRLLLEMKKAGYDIAGFDFTERHIDFVKEQNPDINVFQADWHDTKMPNESQNVVYSLGRNILHDYSIVDQVQTFREANRVLKQGGKFIFDIPNREKGGYKQMVAEYSNEMQKRGIRNFRYGTIYDSPDGVNFATRYTYSHEDIAMLAQMTGFEISLVKKEPLATGKEDENLYYTLEKT